MLLPSLRTLFILHLVIIGHVVLNFLLSLAGISPEAWMTVSEAIGVGEAIAAVIALVWLYRERSDRPGGERVQAALALAAIDLLFELYFTWRTHFSSGGGSSMWTDSVLPSLVTTAATLLLWLTLTSLAAERREETSGLTAALLPLLGVRVLLWIGRAVLMPELYRQLGVEGAMRWMRLMSIASVLLSLAINGLFVVLLRRLIARGDELVAADNGPDGRQVLVAGGGGRDFFVGAIWLTVGLVITIGSFAMASSGAGGGRYMIAYGAIAVGIGRIVRGITRR